MLGSYVGIDNNDIKEYGGKGGSVSISITAEGDVGAVSTDTVSVSEPVEDDGSLGTVLIYAAIAVVVIGVAVAVIVVLKKKK